MQFQIPQFIEKETLLLGPLTVRQSIYIGITVAVSFFLHLVIGGAVAWGISIFLVSSGMALSFLKIEGRDFPLVITSFFNFLSSSKLYLWEMKFTAPKTIKKQEVKVETAEEKYILSKNKKGGLSSLSFELNIKNKEKD